MRRFLRVLLLVCLGATLAWASLAAQEMPAAPPGATAHQVVVRESLEPASGAVIGQHVALRIDVLFRGEMPHPPRVSLLDVAGMQALQFETQGTTLRETIAGESYVGQRFEFALYARRGGTFEIPPASVTLLDRQGGVTGTAPGQAISLTVTTPPGVDAAGPVVATRALTLDETWAPSPRASFKAGDAIVRTITRTAEDVSALAMRDLAFAAPDGVRAYADTPNIDDRSNRGVVTGRRVDRITYVFEHGGRVVLPSAVQPWWDLASGVPKTATASGATIDVAAPASNLAVSDVQSHTWLAWTAAGVVLLVILGLAGQHLMQRRRSPSAYAEREAFAALRRACSGADARAIYRAFTRWRLLLTPARSKTATQAAASLDAAVFVDGAPGWSASDSRSFIKRLKILRASHSYVARPAQLPPLNPGGETAPDDMSSLRI